MKRKEETKKYYVVRCLLALASFSAFFTAQTQFSSTDFKYSLIAFGTDSSSLIIFGAIIISTVIKCSITFTYRPPTTLILKMPIEANEGAMLVAFVLQERLALLHAEFL